MNKSSIPVIVISLDGKHSFNYNKYFSNVVIFPAVDLRKLPPIDLYKKNYISFRALDDLENGRTRHHGLPGTGCIGLWQSYKEVMKYILDNNIKENVLICEQDCVIKKPIEFIKKINKLKDIDFDLVGFGCNYDKKLIPLISSTKINSSEIEDSYLDDFIEYNDNFMLTQSMLWSNKGIKKVLPFLNKPQEVQIDNLFAVLAIFENLKLLMEIDKTTTQEYHPSNLNNDTECTICNVDPKEDFNKNIVIDKVNKEDINLSYCLILIIITLMIYIIYSKCNKCK